MCEKIFELQKENFLQQDVKEYKESETATRKVKMKADETKMNISN